MASSSNGSKPLQVRRAPVGSIDIYEVKDSELEILEKGGPAAIQLNFAVFVFSLAFSALGTLLTATFESDVVKTFYVVVVAGGSIMGAYWVFQWKQSSTSIKKAVEDIRNRMDEDTTDNQIGPFAAPPTPAPPTPAPPTPTPPTPTPPKR